MQLQSPFEVPTWAAFTSLQNQPVPGGEAYESVVRAYRQAISSLQPGRYPTNTQVVGQLRKISPRIFELHNVTRWKEFLPKAQKYVSLHLALPRFRVRDISRTPGEVLVLQNPPYHVRELSPPPFDDQVAALCKHIDLDPEVWRTKGATGPGKLCRTPQAESLPPQLPPASLQPLPEAYLQPQSTSGYFPSLPPTVSAECRTHLQDPRTFWPLVNSFLRRGEPERFLQTTVVWRAMRDCHGEERWNRLLDDCTGFKRYLGCAAQLVKIRWLLDSSEREWALVLTDVRQPFFHEQDNRDFFYPHN